MSARKMTIAQSAVYAALAVRGPCTLTEVSAAVGGRNPSEAARVLAALERQGLVHSSGDASLIYADGQIFSIPSRPPRFAECSECERVTPHQADDYICVVCRAQRNIGAARAA